MLPAQNEIWALKEQEITERKYICTLAISDWRGLD
jgi:hypothetical protein